MKLYILEIKQTDHYDSYYDEVVAEDRDEAVLHFLEKMPKPNDWTYEDIDKQVSEDDSVVDTYNTVTGEHEQI